MAFSVGESEWTVDFYNIEVEDRVALGANVDFLDALNFAGGGTSFTSVSEALAGLDAAGVINRQDFLGLDDLSQFRFFANSFDTETRGIDVVGRTSFDAWDGVSSLTLAMNYNRTEVTDRGLVNPISAGREQALEDLLPHSKVTFLGATVRGPGAVWFDSATTVNGTTQETESKMLTLKSLWTLKARTHLTTA